LEIKTELPCWNAVTPVLTQSCGKQGRNLAPQRAP
jgi:hypothetical protein